MKKYLPLFLLLGLVGVVVGLNWYRGTQIVTKAHQMYAQKSVHGENSEETSQTESEGLALAISPTSTNSTNTTAATSSGTKTNSTPASVTGANPAQVTDSPVPPSATPPASPAPAAPAAPAGLSNSLPNDVKAANDANKPAPAPPAQISVSRPSAKQTEKITIAPPGSNFQAPVPDMNLDLPPSVAPKDTMNAGQVSSHYKADSYLFQNMSSSALEGSENKDTKGDDIDPNHFLPQSEDIQAALYTGVISSNNEVDVRAGVVYPVYWHGKLIIPSGARLLGTASAGQMRDRIKVKFFKIVFASGESLPIDGVAVDMEGLEGIQGRRISDYAQQLIEPLLLQAATGFLNSFNTSNQTVSTFSDGSTVTTQKNQDFSTQLTGAGIKAGQSAAQKIEDIITQDIGDYRPYVYVRGGTPFRIYLHNFIDTTKAGLGK